MKKIRHYYFIVGAICLIIFSFKSINCLGQKIMHAPPITLDTNLVIPPSWAFGILYGGYTDQNQTIERVRNIISHDYPIDAYWIDSWFWSFADKGKGPEKYIDFVADTVGFPNRKYMWSFLEENNIKGGFWIWDCIMQKGNESAFDDFNSKGFFKNTYIETNIWHNNSTTTAMFAEGNSKKGTLCGNINFDDKEAVAYLKKKMKHFFDQGADFIKLDRTSAINVCKAFFEMSQEFGKETKGRGFILSHTGGMESPEYLKYPTKWTDDTRSDWTIEKPEKDFNFWVPKVAFKENIAMYNNPEQKGSKVPFLANDMGGFDMGITDKIDEELYIRWMQFSMFTPIVELFSQPENPTSNLPYLYSERADSLFKIYSHLRMQLFPYIYTYAHRRRLYGEQMMQVLPGFIYEYFFGKELFIAPVYEKAAITRSVVLPKGKWIHYQTNSVYEGDKEYTVDAPIEQIPVFVKVGAIIPLRQYSRSIESGNNDTINLHVFPGADNKYSLIEDDGSSNDYRRGSYLVSTFELKEGKSETELVFNPAIGYYNGISDFRVWKILIHGKKKIQSVTLKDKALKLKRINENLTETHFIRTNKFKKNSFIIKYSNQGDVINLLVIGDSNSAADNSWVNILQKNNIDNYRIHNLSIAGNTIAFDNGGRDTLNTQKNICSYIKRAEKEIGPIDKIIFMLGSNDFKAVFDSLSYRVPENLESLVKKTKTLSKAQIIVVSPPPMAEDSLMDPKYSGGAKKIRKFVSEFSVRANANNIIYINLHDSLATRFKNLNVDGVHLNDIGQQLTAGIIQQILSKY